MALERDEDMTPAELALGLLEGEERAAALRRCLAEPAFAREVETWRTHFALMFEEWPEEVAPEHLLDRIESALEPARKPSRLWPSVAAVLGIVAASLLLVLVLRPTPPAVQVAANPLVASLVPANRGQALPAVYDPDNGVLRVPAAVAFPVGRSAELWMIPADGKPRSLGLLAPGGRTVIRIAPADRAVIAGGLTLAISNEPQGGSPTRQPTGPILASGALIPS